MTKKLIALVFAAGCAFSAAYGGSTFMGGTTLSTWQFAFNASGSYFYPNGDLLSIPDFGFRMGMLWNIEFGIKAYKLGVTTDLKYVFLNNYPFSLAIDGELDLASQFAGGFAVIMDLELNSYTAVYVSARWRYPALYDVDPSYIHYGLVNPSGVMFLTRFGIEILRHNFITVNLEGGAVTCWAVPDVGLNLGVMITWKIN